MTAGERSLERAVRALDAKEAEATAALSEWTALTPNWRPEEHSATSMATVYIASGMSIRRQPRASMRGGSSRTTATAPGRYSMLGARATSTPTARSGTGLRASRLRFASTTSGKSSRMAKA